MSELFGALTTVAPDVTVVALGAPPHVELPRGVRRGPSAPSPPTNLGWNLAALPLAAWRARLDVFHAPAYTAPPWGVHPLVVTIHDVSYERRPEWYPYKRDPLRRWFYRRSARAADHIITVSTFSRDEIVAAYGIDASRIHVIPHGVGAPFRGRGGSAARASGPYVLHVGDLHPRRNLEAALAAVLAIRSRVPRLRDLQLVLAGVDRGSGDTLRARARAVGAETALDFVPVVDDEGLLALYEQARAFVYPSRYEGFGLPVLEAMACGTPVVASRAGSIPEVAGDAAVLVDPDDVAGLANALERVLADEGFARERIAAGRARAGTFTWDRAARLTLEVYELARRARR